MVYCPKCGVENPEDAEECKSCGIDLENAHRTIKEEEEPSSTLIILGYGCTLLGFLSVGILSVVGIILGFIIFRKKSRAAKTHGLIIMLLNSVIILVLALIAIYYL